MASILTVKQDIKAKNIPLSLYKVNKIFIFSHPASQWGRLCKAVMQNANEQHSSIKPLRTDFSWSHVKHLHTFKGVLASHKESSGAAVRLDASSEPFA